MTSSTGKRRSVLVPGEFAQQTGAYLQHLVREAGGDRSGRWLEAKAAELDESTAQKKTYWAKILNLTQAMTTNDIATAAALFDMSPYAFVRRARTYQAEPESMPTNVIDGRFGVGASEQYEPAVAHPRDPEPMDEQ
ncbi:hypothetical protein [Microbacterium sp. 69-10]|uniref:hypothetical protein n=1 Tax=Microbacterium sp. 69-10 TaxID=1895783 RepID=UPI0025F89DD5|nr:hypothetical protein [Microbacterium sp. 69-10]